MPPGDLPGGAVILEARRIPGGFGTFHPGGGAHLTPQAVRPGLCVVTQKPHNAGAIL